MRDDIMKKINLTDEEIIEKLAKNYYWEEGKLHTSIHRLYLDVVCPEDCPNNETKANFCYCEECPFGDVCFEYKGAARKFGTESFIGVDI